MVSSIFKVPADVHHAMLGKVSESGLTEPMAKRLGFKAMTAEQVRAELALPIQKAGFLIPYFNLQGERTEFWRFRFLERTNEGIMVLTDKKDVRYMQPKKSVNEIYAPPIVDWAAIASNPQQAIIITEGELKAACACAMGMPTLGLGGVWCFRSTAQHMPILPQFADIVWKGREVFVCYDSDVASNHMVIQAENAFARELLLLGAIPYITRLPSLSPPRKTGLDDFLVSEGLDAFQEILGKSSQWKAAQELHALNEEVVYVTNPGVVLRLDNMQRIAPRAFIDHAFANRRYFEEIATDKSVKMVERSAPAEWIKWPHRATVEKVTYKPGLPLITSLGEFNIWKGWGCTPCEGDVKPWHRLLAFLFKNAPPETRDWFEQWIAYPLQNPGVKMATSCLFWSREHGVGKSTVGYSMFRIYGENSTEIQDKDLISNFNEWAENRQFVLGDEITGGDKRASADRMKSMITQKLLRLNPKHIPSYTVPDCINYLFTSNHPDAFFLEDKDRRFFIHEIRGAPESEEFYAEYYKWLDGSGANALFYHLLHVDLTGFNPQAPAPMTNSKMQMIEGGRSDLGAWVAQLRDAPEVVLRLGDKVLEYSLWTATELLAMYDTRNLGKVTANGLSRELARAGFTRVYDGQPVPTPVGPQRLWMIIPFDDSNMNGPQLGKRYASERSLVWPKTSSQS